MKQAPKAYFIDIDGTLTAGHNDQQVSYDNTRAMKAAARDGAYIVIASGRSVDAMMEVWKQIDVQTDKTEYIVGNNGAVIMNAKTKKIVSEKYIDEKTYQEVAKYLFDKGYYFKNGGKSEYFVKKKDFKASFIEKASAVNMNLEEFKYTTSNARKIGVISSVSKKKVNKIADEITKQFPKVEVVISGPGLYIEINAKGVSKGEAIKFLSKQWDIDPKHTVHIGDSMNDAAGFEAAGMGIAMANGMKEVKKMADFTTDTCKNDGVAKAINSLRF